MLTLLKINSILSTVIAVVNIWFRCMNSWDKNIHRFFKAIKNIEICNNILWTLSCPTVNKS